MMYHRETVRTPPVSRGYIVKRWYETVGVVRLLAVDTVAEQHECVVVTAAAVVTEVCVILDEER